MKRVLFILKQRTEYGTYSYNGGFSSGLLNSAQFAAAMLARNGFATKVVEVVDNNSIDREVTRFKPDIAIVEALWVVPSKFAVLERLHPTVQWIVRVHSEAAFLAQESIAISWIIDYITFDRVRVAMNSQEGLDEMIAVFVAKGLDLGKLLYLPTFYPNPFTGPRIPHRKFKGPRINVACMGAIRPLKNNLLQAMAAIQFAETNCLDLRFHINSSRVESGGNPVYANLIDLFIGTPFNLVLHDWMPHAEFLRFMATMDLSMQVSFSETFSIIAADSVAVGTPLVGSEAIPWITKESQADLISIDAIGSTMHRVLNNTHNAKANLHNLRDASDDAEAAWLATL
jgi:hypothetical protein